MQNSNTSIAVSSGSGVNPSHDDSHPSWKINTSTPSVADRPSTLNSSARSGCSTLPENKNSNTNVLNAISPMASGSRSPIAVLLSTSRAALPPTTTSRPSVGAARTVATRSWPSVECGSYAVSTDNRCTPVLDAYAGLPGAAARPSTNVPALAVTDSTP